MTTGTADGVPSITTSFFWLIMPLTSHSLSTPCRITTVSSAGNRGFMDELKPASWPSTRIAGFYIRNLQARIFNELLASYRARMAIFNADRRTRSQFQDNDPRFLPAFAEAIGPVAKARLEDAACFIGSLWYTAWVRAHEPDLSGWKSNSSELSRANMAQ